METRLYSIYDDCDGTQNLIANDMTLDTALILLRGLIETYYQEKIRFIIEPQ